MYTKLRQFIRSSLIIESKLDDAKKQYPQFASSFDEIFSDLSSQKQVKYITWVIKQLKKKETAFELKDAINQFEANSGKLKIKDIDRYESLAKLRDALGELNQEVSSETISDKEAKSQATKIYEDGSIIIVRPNTKEASCVYGRGTKWCIAATKTKNYFDEYRSGGALHYFIIDKKKSQNDATAKVAITLSKNSDNYEINDATDKRLTNRDFINIFGSFSEKILEACYKDAHGKELPIEILIQWFDYNDKFVLSDKAFNSFKNHPDFLEKLSKINLSKSQIEDLIKDAAPDVMETLALNRHIDLSLIKPIFENDPDSLKWQLSIVENDDDIDRLITIFKLFPNELKLSNKLDYAIDLAKMFLTTSKLQFLEDKQIQDLRNAVKNAL